jgi:predicted glycosyltransferase involved in capsule biosynthesis
MKTNLTLIAPGRNDNYCGNFVQRLEKNVNKICDNLSKLDVKNVKVLVADWGSPDNDRLSDVLNIKDYSHVEFLHVPLSVTSKIADFSGPHIWNTAFRRTSSDYVMFLEGDTYIPFESFKKLIEIVENNQIKCAWGSRYQIPYDIHSNCETYEDLDNKISEWFEIKDHVTTNQYGWKISGGWIHNKINIAENNPGGATSLLIHRDIYSDARGSFEALTGWGWSDIELHNRLLSKYSFDPDLEDFGIIQFTQESTSQGFGGQIHGLNPQHNSPTFQANDENWGLGDINLKKYEKISI